MAGHATVPRRAPQGCDGTCTDTYEANMVNMIKDVRREFKSPAMAVSIPVSGFDGWMQGSPRRLEIIQQQFESRAATRDASSQGRGGSLTGANCA